MSYKANKQWWNQKYNKYHTDSQTTTWGYCKPNHILKKEKTFERQNKLKSIIVWALRLSKSFDI